MVSSRLKKNPYEGAIAWQPAYAIQIPKRELATMMC